MNLNEIRKHSFSFSDLHKQYTLILSQSQSMNIGSSSNSIHNNGLNPSSAPSLASKASINTTSPNELPPPSPASSVGSSAGSSNTNSNQNANQQSQSNLLSHSSTNEQQLNQIMQKMLSQLEHYHKYNEYNVKSQTCWDNNERHISENKFISG
jgi:hypothetical protein